jgi:pilus assembly protein CpaC
MSGGKVQENQQVQGTPGVPVRPVPFQRNETELVIVITPYLVSGVASPGQLKLPTGGWKPPSDLERLLLLRQSARDPGKVAAAPHIPGDAGFVIR